MGQLFGWVWRTQTIRASGRGDDAQFPVKSGQNSQHQSIDDSLLGAPTNKIVQKWLSFGQNTYTKIRASAPNLAHKFAKHQYFSKKHNSTGFHWIALSVQFIE